ncbi:hypothetical protein [Rossellomorea sp. DA94]|uniref:hypothetical protein n=1 Tax=Rossellomorea sp. DA94 TaxID=3038653 RepID=UPI00244A17C1|nr:hypothetical protein [Rossellomorea sp. DA94]WGG47674.1 hypothetical protein P8596_10890 [Rossellomorea sp. DA94]
MESVRLHKLLDEIEHSIDSGMGYYDSIYKNDEFNKLKEEDKNYINGSLFYLYAIDIEDLVNYCVEEKINEYKGDPVDYRLKKQQEISARVDKLLAEQERRMKEVKPWL